MNEQVRGRIPVSKSDVQVHWYALYVRSRHEKKVAEMLEDRGFDVYCPLTKTSRKWSDRIKIVIEPVFRGYVFLHATRNRLWESMEIPGIVSPVRYLGKPAIIREEEIETIKKFLNEFPDAKAEQSLLQPQSKVRVRQGVMMDYKGIVLEVFGNTALVKIDSLGISLTARFNRDNLEQV